MELPSSPAAHAPPPLELTARQLLDEHPFPSAWKFAASAALVILGVLGLLAFAVTCACERDSFVLVGVAILAGAWFAAFLVAPLALFRWWRAQRRWRREHPTPMEPADGTAVPAVVFIAAVVGVIVTGAFAALMR